MKIHETTEADGSLQGVHLERTGTALTIRAGVDAFELPEGALAAVMGRYGAPLEPGEKVFPVATLELGEGAVVHHVRHLARYDVIARDFLIHVIPGSEPLCAGANTVAGALVHLGRAAGVRAPAGGTVSVVS